MLLWVCFALMTAAVMAALLRPLWRGDADALAPAEADLAVYRDQLTEIDSDRERGLIADAEAASAKTEVARRMLDRAASPDRATGTAPASTASRTQWISRIAAALVPIAAVATYLVVGSPSTPDAPLEARRNVSPENSTIADLIGKVEARLAAKPDDGQGWAVIAPVYMRVNRFADAANAFSRANALLGEKSQYVMGFAEATMLDNDGVVTETARKAFRRVLELEPNRIEAAFALSLAKEQDGDLAGALADYRSMLEKAPAEAAWKAALETRIKGLDDRLAGRTPAPEAPAGAPAAAAPQTGAPNAADVAAMKPEDQAKMIEGMVQRLADRLKTNGKDLPGWLQLIRAYSVLGRTSELDTALADARRNFAGDANALGEIDALQKQVKQGS
jgi:cytochrome c-type biogenesis protein CcmH